MTPIRENAPIVVVGEPDSLARLSSGLPMECEKTVELRTVSEFLIPFDMVTRLGEERRRELEHFYNELRGKIIVRLAVMNLNPESVAGEEEAPLVRLQREWEEIESRLLLFLNDRKDEGMAFVTVVIAEEGDWREEHRDELLKLGGRGVTDGNESRRQRCYLMTRSLELGATQVCHAKDVWPYFVGGLLRFLQWAGDPVNDLTRVRTMLDSNGLFAWRTMRILAGVEHQALDAETGRVFGKVNDRLFGDVSSPLYSSVLRQPQEHSGGAEFETPVSNALGIGDWNLLPDGLLESEILTPAKWKSATEHYGTSERARGLTQLKEEQTQKSEIELVKERLAKASDKGPGALFPGAMATVEIDGRAMVVGGIEKIRTAIQEAGEKRRILKEWWEDHLAAAKSFVTGWERLIVAVVVSMALFYPILAFFFAAHRFLPWSPLTRSHGVWLGLCSVGGVATMLLAGYLTQRWRGRIARKHLTAIGDDYIQAEVGVRHSVTDTLRRANAMALLLHRAAQRRTLHHRLGRLEQVVRNEIQFSGGKSEDHGGKRTYEAIRRILEIEVGKNIGATVDEDAIAEAAVGRFLVEWRSFLGKDKERVAFLPVPELLALCLRHTRQLQTDVEARLREARLKKILEEGTLGKAPGNIEVELGKSEIIGHGTTFFSVDLDGAVANDSVWFRKGFSSTFKRDDIERQVEVDSDLLGLGVIAHWHSECPLEIKLETNQEGRLRFVSNYAARLPTPEEKPRTSRKKQP